VESTGRVITRKTFEYKAQQLGFLYNSSLVYMKLHFFSYNNTYTEMTGYCWTQLSGFHPYSAAIPEEYADRSSICKFYQMNDKGFQKFDSSEAPKR